MRTVRSAVSIMGLRKSNGHSYVLLQICVCVKARILAQEVLNLVVTYAFLLEAGGRDRSALQVAIFDIFVSYFGYGEIYTWFGTLLILKDVR